MLKIDLINGGGMKIKIQNDVDGEQNGDIQKHQPFEFTDKIVKLSLKRYLIILV